MAHIILSCYTEVLIEALKFTFFSLYFILFVHCLWNGLFQVNVIMSKGHFIN